MTAPLRHFTDQELSEFLFRACHDLRTPLRAIRTHAELMARQAPAPQNDEPPRSLSFIVDGAIHAVELVDAITDYSLALQIDAASFQPVPLTVMLRAALAKLGPFLRETNAEVSCATLPTVAGSADRLVQLFELLVDHSARHRGSSDPRIAIAAERCDAGWLIRVRNNSARIGPEFLERIFRPFERVHRKERPGPGLATCRAIVERHGGTLWAESDEEGNTFCFTLPATEA